MQATISTTNAKPVAAAPLATESSKRTKRATAAKPAPAPVKLTKREAKAKIAAALETAKPAPVAKPVKDAPVTNANELTASGFAKLLEVTPVMLRRALRGIKHKRSTKRYVFDRSSPEFASLRAAVRTWLDTDARTKEGKAAAAEPVAVAAKPAKHSSKK
jgi:hypothetical protein